jgi:general secretion pathway protein A
MSYLKHFKLKEQPFRLSPDPDFVYWSKQHARAKAYMESTIWLADGFVVITGEIGSGKTTLLQSFLGELQDDVVYAVVSQTQLKPTQFLQAVLTEFGFKPFDKKKVELLDMLNMFFIEQYSNGKKVVLIVDEAQNLSKKVLEEIRLLSGIETHKEKVLRIILAGQPELKDKLEAKSLTQLMQRVRLRFHIGPLDKREIQEYVEHRLAVAGRDDRKLFANDVYETIHRYTGGVPRLINTLCDTAMLCVFADERAVVERADILSSADELGWEEHESTTGRYRKLTKVADKSIPAPYLTKIAVRENHQIIAEYDLFAGSVVVGRSQENDIFIKSKFVSRRHARLTSDEGGCTIVDLNSTNGLVVDDERVQVHKLKDGDVVSLGIHELIYSDLRSSEMKKKSAKGDGNTGVTKKQA